MGIIERIFGKRETHKTDRELPAILQPENPVNYDSVLDWLLGLDEKDYKKMLEVVEIYRTANKDAAKVLKIKDQPTTPLIEPKPTEAEIDAGLTEFLETPIDDLKDGMANQPDKPEPKKPQAPSKSKKITVNEKK